jgi:hypothetical protein
MRGENMTHNSKGELSSLNLTNGQWHYVENASDGGLRMSISEAMENCHDDFVEAIRQELKKRFAKDSVSTLVTPRKQPTE